MISNEEGIHLPKDGNWKSFGEAFAKSGGQDWKNMSGAVAELVAQKIAEGRANKKKKKDKKKKKK